MRTALLLLVTLLSAASAFGQEPAPEKAPKVWTDADLRKPLPKLHRTVDPAILAAFKARSEAIPFGAGGFGYYDGGYIDAAPAQAQRSAPSWSQDNHARYYARQPLYPVYGWPIIRTYGVPTARPATRPSAGRRR
jgi:hypothetical protein